MSQGYIVLTSTHANVTDYLTSMRNLPVGVFIACCVPSLNLKSEWINILEQRYKSSRLPKDFRAYEFVQSNYTSSIKTLQEKFLLVATIESMDYNLRFVLQEMFEENGLGIYF